MNRENTGSFDIRHIGPDKDQKEDMLKIIGADSIEQLIDETIPKSIRLDKSLSGPKAISEYEYVRMLKKKASKNKVFRSYIGLGYNNTFTPPVIQRNIFENPGWYTQYTPYQAEISQGRLEALLNFQTMVSELTGMELSNASLLDEGTSVAEGMSLAYEVGNKGKKNPDTKFFVDKNAYKQTRDILELRAEPLGIEIVYGDPKNFRDEDGFFGVFIQNPDIDGAVHDYSRQISAMKEKGLVVVMAVDLLSLTMITPPGEWGADVVVGNTQRFGVPMGYGGPHAAFFATKEEYVRSVPGRIIGVSLDAHGNKCYRMTLQTREQHIKRDKATSNICTAQALLAIMAGAYAVYHGPVGLYNIAESIHKKSVKLQTLLEKAGYKQLNSQYFDTISIDTSEDKDLMDSIERIALKKEINFNYDRERNRIGIALDETTLEEDLIEICEVFYQAKSKSFKDIGLTEHYPVILEEKLVRKKSFLQHPVFQMYHTETKMMRYLKSLENKDLSLTTSMIPLGSCTMKLNAAVQLQAVSWSEFGALHPFAPTEQAQAYTEIVKELEEYLNIITGFSATSLQPNSGAQGEYAGLMVIRAYLHDKGEKQRKVVLIPSSAHGTNPASAVMAGFKVVVVKCDNYGNIDVEDLKQKSEKYKDELAALMITYPSTHGVFESAVQEICEIIHQYGGQVYMDGANMNAQVGLTSPAKIGADVCHLNLHKTFSIPHGGGGPGMGPICVAAHLAPYLPGHKLLKTGGEKAIPAVSAAPFGSASILLISYAYIRLLGAEGMRKSTEMAILNANYIKTRLEPYYEILYTGEKGRAAHELIIDLRGFKRDGNIEVEDVAKRLIDYSFHAPTVSFPVPGTMMIEPTESEDKDELDRFCDAMISIREEIEEVISGKADKVDNVLKNAPHTANHATSDSWGHPYTREQAVYPKVWLKSKKFWVPIGRVSNTYGDRNLFCVCPPMESFETA